MKPDTGELPEGKAMTSNHPMTRREFTSGLVAAAGISSTAGLPGAPALDAGDRTQDRDPRAIHRSTIVVNGVDPSSLSVPYLDLLNEGGVAA